MNELTQALLNTCVVSNEAKTKLESLLFGGGTAQEVELYELECTSSGTTLYLNTTFGEIRELFNNNKLPYFQHSDTIYYCTGLNNSSQDEYLAEFTTLSSAICYSQEFSASTAGGNLSTSEK